MRSATASPAIELAVAGEIATMRANLGCKPSLFLVQGYILWCVAVGCWAGAATSAASAETPRQRQHATNALRLRLVPGQRLRYSVSYNSDAGMDLRPALQARGQQATASAPAPIALRSSLRGSIDLLAVQRLSQEMLVECRLQTSEFRINANGQEASEAESLLQRSLQRPIMLILTGEGQIRELRFDPSCDTLTQGVARTLLAQFQFSAPQPGTAHRWTHREGEPNGVFIARYQQIRTARNGITTLLKTKLPTAGQANSANPGLRQSVTPSSDLTLEFDREHGVLRSIQGTETFVTRIGDIPVARTQSVVSFRLASSNLTPHVQLALAQKEVERMISGMTSVPWGEAEEITPTQEAQIQRSNLRGASWMELQTELAGMEQVKPEAAGSDAQALLVRLKACFYLMPETCAQAETLLRTAHADRIPALLLVEALRGAGHARAQQALIAIGRERRNDARFQELLLPTMARLERPTSETEHYFQEMAGTCKGETGSTAILALGTLTHTVAQTSPSRARALVHQMTERLTHAVTTGRRSDWLLALGSAGQAASLPLILRYSHNAIPEIRDAAINALGHQKGNAADQRLAEAMMRDAQIRVRLTAARAAESRPLSTPLKRALLQVLQRDPDVELRLAAARALWRQGHALPDVRASLQAAAAHDANADLRRTLSALLSQS